LKANLRKKFKNVKIIFMDVDGVLNDGKVYFTGESSPKTWYVKDRLGIKILKSMKEPDIKVVWISGRPSDELKARGDELGVDQVFSDVDNKMKVMDEVLSQYNMDSASAMYIGDDLVDLECMGNAGVSCCPADAANEIKEQSDFISSCAGGRGAVREIIEEILRARGAWEEVVAGFKKTV